MGRRGGCGPKSGAGGLGRGAGARASAAERAFPTAQVGFGPGHDLVLRPDAAGPGAGGRLLLGQAYHVPASFGGAAAAAGWDLTFRAAEVEVFQIRVII